jgi:hypothetical protein
MTNQPLPPQRAYPDWRRRTLYFRHVLCSGHAGKLRFLMIISELSAEEGLMDHV